MLILLNTTEHRAPYLVIHKQSSAHKKSSIVPDANKEVFIYKDQDQIEPAIRKTSCGLAHYYVPQYSAQKRSEEPFCHASVAELWRFKQFSESLLKKKKEFFFPNPFMTLLW